MRQFFLCLVALLVLGAGPAAAMRPLASVVVASGVTTTFTGAPNRGTGDVTTYNNNFYQSIDIRSGGVGVFNDGENVGQLIVRTGGTLRFGVDGEISSANPNVNSTATNTIVLEPGAIIQLATPNGLPFAQGAYNANNPNDNFGSGSGASGRYSVTGAAGAYYTFNGSAAQTTAAPAAATRGGFPTATASGIALPGTVARVTLSNSAGLTMVNSTGVTQLLSILRGQLTVASSATLTLLSTSNGTAQLDLLTSIPTISGNFAVQRYIDGSLNAGTGYRHLSAPITGQTMASFANGSYTPSVNPAYNANPASVPAASFPTVFSYDQTKVGGSVGAVGFDQGWQSPNALTDGLVLGRGYTVNTPPTAATGSTLTFTGAPTTADVAVSNLGHTTANGGFHLLGNPYAAPLYWDNVVFGFNGGPAYQNLANALYVFKSSGQYAGSYTTYVPSAPPLRTAATAVGTPIIPVGQAFFVYNPSQGTTGSVTFRANYTTIDNATPVQRTAAETRPYLALTLQDATHAHQTMVYFDAAATAGFDAQNDALYLPGAGQALSLTSAAAGQEYAINALPALGRADVAVPLRLRATAAGTYTLKAEELANLPAGTHAYLLDATTGTRQDLATTPSATITLAANASEGARYSLLFTGASPLATAPAALAQLAGLYPNPAHGTTALVLPATLRGGQPVPVAIVNSLGQVVRRATATADELTLPLDGLAAGLYTVQARTVAGTISRRLTVE
jgi:hypothetical protein